MIQAVIQYASFDDVDLIEADTVQSLYEQLLTFAHGIVTSKPVPDLPETASVKDALMYLRHHFAITVDFTFP